MNEKELIADSIITGEHNYIAALDLLIATAQDELLIFDQDFLRGDYTSAKRFDLIHDFLSKSPLSKLTIILQKTTFFTENCPRLFKLLVTYNHKMAVYETNDHAKIAKDCFVLADKRHYLRRFHIDQARFKFALNDLETTASLNNRFNELLQETTETISIARVGL
ncbi:MAG: DUF7931 domain-containing protein [Methylophilaceae bacterium]